MKNKRLLFHPEVTTGAYQSHLFRIEIIKLWEQNLPSRIVHNFIFQSHVILLMIGVISMGKITI
ncbi:MAG TPA: hypothetical protein DIW81_26415 [Planctomycetaceae bacterium]|nr:hypothetical protein [Planctomycetaceae bacterium]